MTSIDKPGVALPSSPAPEPKMVLYCEEHEIPLNADGTCPQCRDKEGKPFILDMQSTYFDHPSAASSPAHETLCMCGLCETRRNLEETSGVALPSSPAPTQPQLFRTKPVEKWAIQWDGSNTEQVLAFSGGGLPFKYSSNGDDEHIYITTLEGRMRADIWDWIIKGVKGEFYPCKPDIFAINYEPVESVPSTPSPTIPRQHIYADCGTNDCPACREVIRRVLSVQTATPSPTPELTDEQAQQIADDFGVPVTFCNAFTGEGVPSTPVETSAQTATPSPTAEKLAGQFCDEMITNLRHNVGEQKKRVAMNFAVPSSQERSRRDSDTGAGGEAKADGLHGSNPASGEEFGQPAYD